MAHSNNSIITGKLTGSIGKELAFREWKGKTIVAKAPKKRTGEPTPAQAEVQEKFFMASRYAKAILSNADPALTAAYTQLTLPLIGRVAAGSPILVRAIDDFRVTQVRVEIYDASGALHESGNAVQNLNGLDWTYIGQLDMSPVAGSRVKAYATDVPGNVGVLEQLIS